MDRKGIGSLDRFLLVKIDWMFFLDNFWIGIWMFHSKKAIMNKNNNEIIEEFYSLNYR
jgi:hypothetical protein